MSDISNCSADVVSGCEGSACPDGIAIFDSSALLSSIAGCFSSSLAKRL